MKRAKTLYSLLACAIFGLVLSTAGYSQIIHPTSGVVTLEACEDFFDGSVYYDSGGANGPYQLNESGTLELCADCGQTITVDFDFFDVEAENAGTCWDVIVITGYIGQMNPMGDSYSGDDSDGGATVGLNCLDLTDSNGQTTSGGGSGANSSTFTSYEGGCLSFQLLSDNTVNESGWAATIGVSSCETVIPVGGAVACNNQVQVSLDQDCSAEITADMILEGSYPCYENFQVLISGVTGPVVTEAGTYVVTILDVISGNSCWANITVEDNIPPVVEDCPCDSELNGLTAVDAFSGNLSTSDEFDTGLAVDLGGCIAIEQGAGNLYYDTYTFAIVDKSNMVTTCDVTFEVIGAGSMDTYVALYSEFNPDDICENWISADDDGGIGLFSQLTTSQTPDAMTYYTLVMTTTGFGGTPTTGSYTITITPAVESCEILVEDPRCIFTCYDVPSEIEVPIVITDACSPFSTDYFDTAELGDCGESYIHRTWTMTYEAHGELITEPVCTQTFLLRAATLDDVHFPEAIVYLPCGAETSMPAIANYYDQEPTGNPFGVNPYNCGNLINDPHTPNDDGFSYAYPYVIGTCGNKSYYIPLNPTVCNLNATKSDQTIFVCGAGENQSKKVLRTWVILDWCTAEVSDPFLQIIKAIDEEPPVIEVLVPNDPITVSADPWGCEKVFTLPIPEHLYDDCSGGVNYWVEIAGITNDPFNLPFSETHTSSSNPHYFPLDMIDGNAQNGYTIVALPKGSHIVTYTAEDECGNQSTDQIVVNVVDETPPVAIAKENIVISLTSGSTATDGTAKLYVESVDNGSHDGCSGVFKQIRRDGNANDWSCDIVGNNTYTIGSTHPYHPQDVVDGGQYVKFCCDDLALDGDGDGVADGLVKVWMRVWDDGDMNGIYGSAGDNWNETWAYVKVEDKLAPVIHCPPNISVSCDMDLDDLSLVGTATAFGTCGPRAVKYTDAPVLNSCGTGFVIRTWFMTNANGSRDFSAPFCTQRITVGPLVPFSGNDITWPAGTFPSPPVVFNCLPGTINAPSWDHVPCSLVGMTVERDTFRFEDGACYKILNRWKVIDWCQYTPGGTAGIWERIQVIKVEDTSKPSFLACDDVTLWATEDCKAQDVILTNVATDAGSNCPSDWLKWEICLDINYDWTCDYIWTSYQNDVDHDNGVFYIAPSAQGDDVDIPTDGAWDPELDLPVGEHRVNWKVNDGCGNISACEYIVTVEDKKSPTPYCIQNLSTAVMSHGGMVEIWASDFNLASEDNCTDQEDLQYTFANGDASRLFTCADLIDDGVTQIFDLEMWVWDEYGNGDYCNVQLRVDDNVNACEDGVGMAMIAGQIVSRTGDNVSNVEVELMSTAPEYPVSIMTENNGLYAFNNNPMIYNYELSTYKTGDYHNGVSTLDMVLIQQHILALQTFESAYKVIAADINSDQKVSAIDLLDLRKLILGVQDEFPNNESWRFVDASQTFNDLTNPWPFAEVINIDEFHGNMMDNNFVGVKIGDVSGDAKANLTSGSAEIRTNASLDLMTSDRSFAAGDVVRVDISSEDFNDVYGYQFTMNYSGLVYAGIEAGALDMTADNFGLHRTNEGMISTSWASSASVSTSEVLFSIIFTATENGQLSESISIGSAITPAEAYRGSGLSVENVSIEFRTDNGSVSAREYVLYQNEPNPFASATVIGFELPSASEATISVYDVTGKVIKVVRGEYAKGYNEVSLERKDLNSAGVLYYQLESGEYTATKKMILID